MSYIEEKYRTQIEEILTNLIKSEKSLLKLLKLKSIKEVDKIAQLCSEFNKQINIVLKKYPEIKKMDYKLDIKTSLKFYYDLIDKLTDFVRNVENFKKIDDKYYDFLINFIEDKEKLIDGKYRSICSRELTAFYDKNTRDNLEKILNKKFDIREKQFFAIGPLEEEIKKIGKIAGANEIVIYPASVLPANFDLIDSPKSLINYTIPSSDESKLKNIGNEIKKFLISKGYNALVMIVEMSDISEEKEILTGSVICNAHLLPD
ncbi:MAG: hypothetical protein GF383_12070 [Candidatus Lokiarchaeota archaeon]|nr:hypothetical protein [Candidatus Lokiarchaeota archaeon]MBD3341642.1 hypothetical protein [Candidatus Lokiarchaeota archaeon]